MNALVISGGGSKGAYGGGVAQYLLESGKEYDMLIGTSTGALLCPLLSVGEIELLKRAYTTITNDNIFKINPFKITKNKNGSVKIAINHWNVIKNMIFNDIRTFGDSSALEQLISNFLTDEIYDRIKISNKDVVCTVTNVTLAKTEYHSTRENDRDEFIKWLHASASVPPFMNIIEQRGSQYADGGLLEQTPLQEAINRGATSIDVIFLRNLGSTTQIEKIRNPFHYITRLVDIMMTEVISNDIDLSRLILPDNTDVTINVYPLPRPLTNNSLVFDKDSMLSWWEEGYVNTQNMFYRTYSVNNTNRPSLVFDGITTKP